MRYKDIDFVGLTKILRAHATQIIPPGMRELKNVYIARSDNSVTLRPDFMQDINGMPSLSEDLQGDNYAEFLTGIYRALDIDGYIYFSNITPFSFEGGIRTDLPTTYDDGTITTKGIRAVVVGEDTKWLERAWAGCLIREVDSEDWYVIESVQSNTYITTNGIMPALTASEYEILRTWPRQNAAWPIQFEKLGDMLVCGPINPTLPVNQGRISGPFYSDVGKLDLFGGVWRETEPEVDPIEGNFNVVASNRFNFPNLQDFAIGAVWSLIAAGENGICVFQDQWVSDYNSANKDWAKIKDDYFYLGLLGRNKYPQGNGFPVTDVLELAAVSSDSSIVHIENNVNKVFLTFDNGDYVNLTVEDLLTKTSEELLDDGTFLPTAVPAPVNVLDPPAYGSISGYMYGGKGQIQFITYSPVVTGVSTSIYGASWGQRVKTYPAALDPAPSGTVRFFVGGVDGSGATIFVLQGGNPGTVHRILDYGIGSSELYDITYMHSLDEGPYGVGTWVAVGENGKIIYSDDGGNTWEEVLWKSWGNGVHLRKVDTDVPGRCAMAVGDNGTCLVSNDAEIWQSLTVTEKDISGLTFDVTRGDFIVVTGDGSDPIRIKRRHEYGSNGSVMTRRVGIISSSLSDAVMAMVWTGSLFVAAGSKTWTSPTGSTWTERDSTAGILSLAHDESGTVVAAGVHGTILRSTNHGASWTTIHAADSNPFIDGDITSVMWDGTNFFCCGDKSILISSDGSSWADDTSFDYDEEPEFLSYRGLFYEVLWDEDTGPYQPSPQVPYFSLGGNLNVICKSGAWYSKANDFNDTYPNYEPDWNRQGIGEDEDGNSDVSAIVANIEPSGFVASRAQFRVAAVDGSQTIQTFWGFSTGTYQNQGYIEHAHLSGFAHSSNSDVGDQEPGVLRGPIGDGSSTSVYPTETTGLHRGFNNLLVHDDGGIAKEFATPILFWLHGTRLLISTDFGQTWSRGRYVIIPGQNRTYVAPVSGQSGPGQVIKQMRVSSPNLSGSGSTSIWANPMVSDGSDVYLASAYTSEGIVFLNLTWDGLKTTYLDPDFPPADVVPDPVTITSQTTNQIIITAGSVTVT